MAVEQLRAELNTLISTSKAHVATIAKGFPEGVRVLRSELSKALWNQRDTSVAAADKVSV